MPFFIFILTDAQKRNYRLVITNINENHKITEYKKSSKLIFNDLTNISDFDPSSLNADSIEFKNNISIIYDVKFIKNLNSSNSLYLLYNNLNAYIEKN